MTRTDEATAGRLRDPFAVPSGTTTRFALLVVTTSTVIMHFVGSRLGPVPGDVKERYARYAACWEEQNRGSTGLPSPNGPSAVELCGADPRQVDLWVPLTGLLVFWLVVLAVYWLLPAWRVRRRRYALLGEESAAVTRALEALRQRTGCEPVHWYAQSLDVRVSALAFGRRGHRCVVLSGGLLALRNRRPETFEAVVLHELAHVRNRDIDLSFLTIISARVSLPVLVLTVASGVLWEHLHGLGGTGSLAAGLSNSLKGLCLVVAMPLTRRAVLRSREYYADARARQWAGSPAALRALLEVKENRRRLPGRLLRVHPTARQRRDMLDDPEPLFRSGFWELLAAGCVLGALYTDLATTFVLNSALGPGAETAREVLALGTLGTLLAVVVAFFTLRLQEGFPGGRPGLLGAPVWGLACGIALGGGVANPGVTFALASVGQVGAGLLPWTALLALGGYAAVRWTAAALPWWRPVLRGPHARAAWCVLPVAAGALFGCVLVWLMELMVTQALMSTLLGGHAPELVSFLLGAASDAVVRSPFLLCAALLAALIPLLGQAAPPGARAARQALGRTVAGALRAGLWLAAALALLGSGPRVLLAYAAVAALLAVLAVRTGRRPRPGGLPFAHATLAAVLAAVTAHGGAALLLTLVTPQAAPGPGGVLLAGSISALLAVGVAACVPTARRGTPAAG
ncbi:M48 family metalloprotease [Streptomyces koyangensis]